MQGVAFQDYILVWIITVGNGIIALKPGKDNFQGKRESLQSS
jgi:hypothetical protein